MISKSMFFSNEVTIKDYRDIKLDDVLREFLLFKGTRNRSRRFISARSIAGDSIEILIDEVHHEVSVKEIVSSGLFVYKLKANSTNMKAIEYYCEREATRRGLMNGDRTRIFVPKELWNECDEKNKEFTNGRDRDPNCIL